MARLTVRPLKKDAPKLNELVRVLKIEFFSARPEAEPTETVSPRIRPLTSEPPIVNDPVKDLNHDICSEKLVEEPSDPTKFTIRPLACEPAKPRLVVKDLSSDFRKVIADDVDREPLRDRK